MMNNLAIIATLGVYSLVSSISMVGVFMAYNDQPQAEELLDTSLLRGGSRDLKEEGGDNAAADDKAATTLSPKKSKEEEAKARKARLLENTNVLVTAPEPLELDDKKALLETQLREVEKLIEEKSKLWCGRDYKHLVESCPKPCDENRMCGSDEDGNHMTCFNMKDEEESCLEAGVGVKDPVDPSSMWCGQNWSHALGQCSTPCPKGGGCPGGEMCWAGVECTSRLEAKKKAVQNTTPCVEIVDEEFCKDSCFEPVNSNDCPKSANEYLSTVVKKCTNNVKDGELCEADDDGQCNTSDDIDNCSIDSDGYIVPISIYRRVACCDQRSDVQKSHALPAEITAALENAGVEVFNVPLDEVIGIVGNIVGEAIEIPSDATTSEIHSEIIAALDKTGINVPEVA